MHALALPLVALDAARPLAQLDHVLDMRFARTTVLHDSGDRQVLDDTLVHDEPTQLLALRSGHRGWLLPALNPWVGWAVEMGCRDAREAFFVATPRDPVTCCKGLYTPLVSF